jgi:quercetin dioxygenase-like cupin family protein
MISKFMVAAAWMAAGLSLAAVASEDALVADPAHYSVEFENDRVRVIRIKYGPGEKSVMHTHGPNASIMLTDAEIRMHLPDGSSVDFSGKRGDVQWADAEEHLPENTGDAPFEVVLIELKD